MSTGAVRDRHYCTIAIYQGSETLDPVSRKMSKSLRRWRAMSCVHVLAVSVDLCRSKR
jgi:hypothetical protein